jgi:predicted O-linked N-acetylglucosamine transferase (SPINDLY family)
MEEYINKNLNAAEEYLESGLLYGNVDYVIQAKSMYSNMYDIVSHYPEKSVLVIEKMIRACTGLCLFNQGNPQEHLTEAEKYLEFLDIKHEKYKELATVIYNNKGYLLHHKSANFDAAIENYNKCLEIDDTYEVAYNGILDIYRSLRHYNMEFEYSKKAIKKCPKSADLLNTYTLALLSSGKYDGINKITELFNKALMLTADDSGNVINKETRAKIFVNIGHVNGIIGNYCDAILNYIDSIQTDPTHINAYQNILLNLHYFSSIDNVAFKILIKMFNVTLKKNESTAQVINKLHYAICSRIYPNHEQVISNVINKDYTRKINIGYVSSDLFQHAVSYFANVLFKNRNKEEFKVHIYANNIYDIGMVNSLSCDSYKCILNVSDIQVKDIIIKDEIDILIDLGGQTAGNRLGVFALKPAPILLTYLGYPNDTGIKGMMRISDKYTEMYNYSSTCKLDRLFLCYSNNNFEYKKKDKKSGKNIVFGCFAKLQKINNDCIKLWKGILMYVKDSVLVLKSRYFKDESIKQIWKEKFGDQKDRIMLLTGTETTAKHLELFYLIDIHLDTFPYSGTTISTESLFMNVPVVTLSPIPGKGNEYIGHVERVTGSILKSMRLADSCIATSKTDYINKCVELAKYIKSGKNLEVRKKFLESEISNNRDFIEKYETLLMYLYLHN